MQVVRMFTGKSDNSRHGQIPYHSRLASLQSRLHSYAPPSSRILYSSQQHQPTSSQADNVTPERTSLADATLTEGTAPPSYRSVQATLHEGDEPPRYEPRSPRYTTLSQQASHKRETTHTGSDEHLPYRLRIASIQNRLHSHVPSSSRVIYSSQHQPTTFSDTDTRHALAPLQVSNTMPIQGSAPPRYGSVEASTNQNDAPPRYEPPSPLDATLNYSDAPPEYQEAIRMITNSY